MSIEHSIDFTYRARFRTLGEIDKNINQFWLVCHGHGHLAEYFIRQFQCLNNSEHLIVAPEGLSKYYLKGFTGRVGATWMTREDRLNDIDNYLRYLASVYEEIRPQLREDVKVTFFGFSQGAATISRFATQGSCQFDRLVLWAGIFPPDLPDIESAERLSEKNIYWVYGTKDPYLSAGIMEEQGRIADRIKVTPQVISFEGEHELNDKILMDISAMPYHRQK